MVYIKPTWYIFNHFYEQYLVLLTMVPRNSISGISSGIARHIGQVDRVQIIPT